MSAGKFAAGAAAFLLLSGGVLAVAGHYMGAEHELTVQRDGWSAEVSPFSLRGLNNAEWENGWDGWNSEHVAGTVPDRPVWKVPNKYQDEVEAISVTPEAFTKLDIRLDMSDVIVERGAAYGLELKWYSNVGYTMDWSQTGDTLEIFDYLPKNSMNGNNHVSGFVVVTLPMDAALDDLSLNVSMGEVYLEDVKTRAAALDSDMGDLTFLRGSAEQMTVNNSMGAMVMADSTVADSLDVYADMGDVDLMNIDVGKSLYVKISMGDMTLSDSRVNGALTAEADMGGVSLSGELACDIDVTSSMSEVDIRTTLGRDQYTYDLKADMGEVRMDGVGQKDDRAEGGQGGYHLTAAADMGSVTVSFGGVAPVSKPSKDTTEIVDLPNELYREAPEHEDKTRGMSAGVLSYDFSVEETTLMDIEVENLSGVLELGIRKAVGGWAYDQRPWDSESDSVELEPGRYTVVIHAETFQGSYHLTGETVA